MHATFERLTWTLFTSVQPAYGTLTVSPPGPYFRGADTPVTITVTPWYPSYYLDEWGGACPDPNATSCQVTMDGHKTVIAYLAEDCDPNIGCRSTRDGQEPYTLAVTVSGAGTVSAAGPAALTEQGADFDVKLTARWSDATHQFGGWGRDCNGTASTCVLTMDADKTVTAEITELPADRCAEPSAADCIRAVFRGAPEDYAQVTDIPASALVTLGIDGRYEVRRGEQVTVVTAAPLSEGYAGFHLSREPQETPSPVSSERLVTSMGTTYTFTPAVDGESAAIITFDLAAANPPAEPGLEPQLGDVVVTTTFRVGVPPAPGTVDVTLVDGTFAIRWDEVAGADNYRLSYQRGSEVQWSEFAVDTGTDTIATWTPATLACGDTYTLRVEAQGDGSTYSAAWGEAATSVAVQTPACDDTT